MVSKKINKIQYSVLDPKKIRDIAVVKIVSPELYDKDGFPVDGGLFDTRMGVVDPGLVCKTCGLKFNQCLGHFGYIELARPVIHPFYITKIKDILSCVCFECGKLLISEEKIEKIKENLEKIHSSQRKDYLKNVLDQIKKIRKCPHCGKEKNKIIFERPYYFYEEELIEKNGKKEEVKNKLNNIVIRSILEKVPDEHLFVFDLQLNIRPEWFVLVNLLVPPPKVRPSIILETGERSEDDLTHKLVDIVRVNQKLLEYMNAGTPEAVVNDLWDLLQYHVATYFDNEFPGIIPAKHRSGRDLKTLMSRIKGKEGRLRYNLAGKRVNFAARTVISVDPFIKPWEVGVPIEVAKTLTVPERVNEWNIDYLKEFIKKGPNKWPGANYIITPDGKRKKILEENIEQILEEIDVGYVVERHLIDGDIALFNRQPTLHKLSIMAHEVRVLPGKTFRIHPAVCPPYNADFDGDEMNLHIPQTEEARVEARMLLHITKMLITPKYGEIIIGATYDALSGIYVMINKKWKRKEAIELLIESGLMDKVENLPNEEEIEGIKIIEAILPNINYEDDKIVIKNGKIIKGEWHKGLIKEGSGSLIKEIYFKKGEKEAFEFLHKIFKLGIKVLNRVGLTITLDDSNIPRDKRKEIKKKIEESYKRVEKLIKRKETKKLKPLAGKSLEETLEVEIVKELNNLRTEIGKLVENIIKKDTGTMIMINSGAKGKLLNLVQIAGIIGQQTIEGKRIDFGYKGRNLSLFKKNEQTPVAKGFVDKGLREGLDPVSFFFTAMTGRDSLIDQQLNTPKSGYLYRRLSNALTDVKVKEKGIVFDDSVNQVVQFRFGEDGLSVEKGKLDLDKIAKEVLEKE